jgi:hypothetical protein
LARKILMSLENMMPSESKRNGAMFNHEMSTVSNSTVEERLVGQVQWLSL